MSNLSLASDVQPPFSENPRLDEEDASSDAVFVASSSSKHSSKAIFGDKGPAFEK